MAGILIAIFKRPFIRSFSFERILKMSVKINGKKLHLTTFEVPTNGKNIRRCLVAQKKFAEADLAIKRVDTDDEESIINSLEAQIKLIDTYTEFLKPVLGLSDAQVEKVENSDFEDVVSFTTEVIDKVLKVDGSKSNNDK